MRFGLSSFVALFLALLPALALAVASSDAPSHTPLVPANAHCYKSADDLAKASSNCSGHGQPVKSLRGCYACLCKPSKKDKQTTYWSGKSCELEDISSQFILLAGTTIGLIVVVAASVKMLASSASGELPPQLAAVGASRSHGQ